MNNTYTPDDHDILSIFINNEELIQAYIIRKA